MIFHSRVLYANIQNILILILEKKLKEIHFILYGTFAFLRASLIFQLIHSKHNIFTNLCKQEDEAVRLKAKRFKIV